MTVILNEGNKEELEGYAEQIYTKQLHKPSKNIKEEYKTVMPIKVPTKTKTIKREELQIINGREDT